MSISIIVPWQDKSNDPARRRVAEFVIDHYRSTGIGEVVVGTYPVDDQPLNRSRLRNEGAKLATGDVLVFIDAEILVPTGQLVAAVELAAMAPGPVFPLSWWWTHATEEQTERIFDGEPFEQFIQHRNDYRVNGKVPLDWMVAPTLVISRAGFEEVGGYDEEFVGWGEEDREFNWRAHHLLGDLRVVDGGFLHLFHIELSEREGDLAYKPGTPEHARFARNCALFRLKSTALLSRIASGR